MAITGNIITVEVPRVPAGQPIKVTTECTAHNPDGSFINAWALFIVAKDNAGHRQMLKHYTIHSSIANCPSDTWVLWNMPNTTITLEVRLYGHDETLDWDWNWWK